MTMSLLVLIIVEGNFYMVLRPLYKPALWYVSLVHESVQVRKQRQSYDIREIASMDDYEFAEKPYVTKIVDQDPANEAKRVKALKVKDAAVRVSELTKAFKPFTKAVDGLSFGLEHGDCFALLGITGAGKTTTFKCLC